MLIFFAFTSPLPGVVVFCGWYGTITSYFLLRNLLNRTTLDILDSRCVRITEGPFWPIYRSQKVEGLSEIVVRGHDAYTKTYHRKVGNSTHSRNVEYAESYSVFAMVDGQEHELFYQLKRSVAIQLASEIASKLDLPFAEDQIGKVPPKDMPFISPEREKREGIVGCLWTGLLILGVFVGYTVVTLTN